MPAFRLADAVLQKEEIVERIKRLRKDLELTIAAIGRAQHELGRVEEKIDSLHRCSVETAPTQAEQQRTGPGPSRLTNPSRSAVTDAVLQLIAEAGVPLTRAELFDRLTAKGYRIEGKNPLMVFSTMLWRERNRIARLRGFGYWPADKSYPPAQYSPGTDQPSLL